MTLTLTERGHHDRHGVGVGVGLALEDRGGRRVRVKGRVGGHHDRRARGERDAALHVAHVLAPLGRERALG